ncbi:hypothetical protein VNO80_33908 [Phaseolus coccineus]|uniref:Uncharacterized protein n=1 Tax=Phaseolus coccineus TaxID=3886 RepID=A0AAN9KY96_PHACN
MQEGTSVSQHLDKMENLLQEFLAVRVKMTDQAEKRFEQQSEKKRLMLRKRKNISDGACGTVVAGNVPSCDACCSGSLSPVDRRTRY